MKYDIFIFEKKKIKTYHKRAADEYRKRLLRYCKCSCTIIKKEKEWKKRWTEASDKMLVLPGVGSVSSEAFSEQLSQWERRGQKISFFIPDLSEQSAWYLDIKKDNAYFSILNLSDFTMEPGLSGVILFEQIYRGYRIMHHHPYHK